MAESKITKTKSKTAIKTPTKKVVAVKKTVKKTEKKPEAVKFAVIAISGVQMKVFVGQEYELKKMEGKNGDIIEVKEVLLISDGKDTRIGKPYIKDALVKLEITSQKKGPKQEGFTFSAKSRHRRNYGFRESITKVIVKSL